MVYQWRLTDLAQRHKQVKEKMKMAASGAKTHSSPDCYRVFYFQKCSVYVNDLSSIFFKYD